MVHWTVAVTQTLLLDVSMFVLSLYVTMQTPPLSEQLQEAASIAIDSDASLRLYSTFDQFRSYFDGFPIDLLETQMYSQA